MMANGNLVSIEISDADVQNINGALQTLKETLKPYISSLTPDDRRELPKMSDRTVPFVSKTLEYAESNEQFAPAYMNVAELNKDVKAVETLTQFFRQVEDVYKQLDDTIMLAGSEAYVASLAFYNSIKLASRMNVPGAEPIYRDLKERFDR
ncbi:MAG: hypothetical protein AB7T22_16635 [Calditrichaceae bacterium]